MAEYDYNELGQLSSKKLHKEGNNEFIQAITHQYNIRGWLTHINNNTRTTNLGTEQPLFGMELYYNTLPTSFGNVGIKQFNGNISATSWSSIRDKEITNANIIRGFTYSYDKMNRLITANFQSVKPEELGRYSTTHSYDVNGNIQTTQRSGVISSNGLPQSVVYQYGQMDNMQYSYAGNRLIKVNDAITTQTTLPDFPAVVCVRTNNSTSTSKVHRKATFVSLLRIFVW